jgi:hypothetical protein
VNAFQAGGVGPESELQDMSAVTDAEGQRSSGRPRTPTKRLAESNLSLVFLSGEGRMSEHAGSSLFEPPSSDGEGAGRTERKGRGRAASQGRGSTFKRRESGIARVQVAGREKRRRGLSVGASDENGVAPRPKRAAAILGEVKREIGLEKLFTRRGGRANSGKKPSAASSARSRHSREPSREAARRPASNAARRRSADPISGRVARSRGGVAGGRSRRQIPVTKSSMRSKTRLDLTSLGSSSTTAAGRRGASAAGKSVVRGEEADDVSTGSSSNGSSDQGSHRRDWGLMEVDAVGRNRPPFARTMLYHGTVPFPLPADLSDQTPARNWVIKRWPEKGNRRKIDQEVHECIKNHPHPYLVRIVDVSPSEGVLME